MKSIRRPRSKRHKPNAEINVVPYIDVMMVLLVTFMVTAPMMMQGVDVDLPKANSDPIKASSSEISEPLIVTVTRTGDYYLNLGENNQQAISLNLIGNQVKKILDQKPDTEILLRGDRTIDYGQVVKLMTILQQAGATSVGLISDRP